MGTNATQSPDAELVPDTEAQPCPYDENLLERSRTQWQFGDWESLAALNRETLQHHPDRAKLALLAAAGHTQQGNIPAARHFAQLARDWGCSKALMNQVLIAGVHNTLGRAAAISGFGQNALKHFESAINTGSPGSDRKLLTQARVTKQLEQLNSMGLRNGLERDAYDLLLAPPLNQAAVDTAGLATLTQEVRGLHADLNSQLKVQQQEALKLRSAIEGVVKRELLNSTKQIEAFLEIQEYFRSGNLVGELHGWPISPDFALLLVNMLAEIEYDLVIEFGSGTSTALIAKSLAVINPRRQAKGIEPIPQLSFEHLREYYEKTSNSLRQAGLEHAVELVHAPLAPLVLNGLTYQYYECQATIEKARLGLLDGKPRVLVLVDGPPASTGRHARYPGTPIVLEIFSDAEVDVILDDYNRTDEKEIVNMWASDCKAFGLNCVIREIALDKGACFVEIRSDKANTENTD
jgi:hypothetical protein